MQDEHEGFIGKLNDEEKDYHGTRTTAASIQNKSPNYKNDSIMSVTKSYAIKPKIETIRRHNEDFNSTIKSQLNKEYKYSRKRGYPKSIFMPEISKEKEASYEPKNYGLPPINKNKSYLDGSFTKGIAEATTSKYATSAKNTKFYNLSRTSTFTPTKNTNVDYKNYKAYIDENSKTNSSSNLLPLAYTDNKVISNRTKNQEKWWNTKIGVERSRKPKQQNLNLFDGIEDNRTYNNGESFSEDAIEHPVSSSKLHMVRVLPPKDFIDRMKENALTKSPPLTKNAEPKWDKKTVDLMRMFIDHTDDFELNDKEIIDLKERAKHIEDQISKRSLEANANPLEGRQPRLSNIILQKMKEAEERDIIILSTPGVVEVTKLLI